MKTIYKFTNYLLFTICLFLVFTITFCTFSYGAYPKLISTLNSAFEKIESWIIKISTPAAAIAVGSGVLMKKFSFGDEEKMRTGKKLIKSSLFSYAFILSIDLILSTINTLVG